MTYTIAVTDFDFPDLSIESAALEEMDAELVTVDAESPSDIVDAVPEANALLVQYATISETVFDELEDLRAVGRYGIGVDNVDLDAATNHGVWVVNVPSYCEEEVSTHSLSLMLNCLRNVSGYDRAIKDGRWDWTEGKPINRISGKTIGFAGFGKIPQHLMTLLGGFDLDYVAYDPYLSRTELTDQGVDKVDFGELLSTSDVLSVHVPLTDETKRMFDADAFSQMQDHAIIVNTARGAVIDTNDLHTALQRREIAGAGLDVMPVEPPEDTSLIEHENVVCTPHVAWYSEESMAEMRRTVTQDVAGIIRENAPKNPVNDLE
ncbi:C-terminal binding protein [Halomontanus rarus]|uniref:C-terminal binding protein n=1 Tax=Halomontanus rarus TaxID=3034020 RepID=UPI0023E8977C|nr:C-terminal binding protein [Halovivax sp. TS33]